MIQSEEAFPGLSLDVIKRLDDLKGMEADLRARGKDPSGLGPNIAALINAYRTRQLDWHPGLVTYWSNGIQICQPRPFHYQEFLQVNQLYNGHASFWVEGVSTQFPRCRRINSIVRDLLIFFLVSSFSHRALSRNSL